MKHESALAALRFARARATKAIALERAVRAALPPGLAVWVWLIANFVGLLEAAPPLASTLIQSGALALIAALLVRACRSWRRPSPKDVDDRLALDSGLDRARFASLEDRPAKLDPLSLALWERERGRALTELAGAKSDGPRLFEKDRYRLRWALPALLIAAAVFAGPNLADRLEATFVLDPGPLLGDKPLQIEAWATPASYTGAAAVSLSDRIGARVKTPPSPEATVRISGPAGPPRLVYESAQGSEVVRFAKAADGAYEAKLRMEAAGTLRVVRFRSKARWRIEPGPDAPPTIAFVSPPIAAAGETLKLRWKASDDFGVRGLVLRLTPLAPPPGLVGAPPVDVPIAAPAGDPRTAEGEAELDVADNPYAGLRVQARLVAVDARGQEGVSAVAPLAMPERRFLQPLARAAIEIRKLILFERRRYAPRQKPLPRAPNRLDAWVVRSEDDDPTLSRAPRAIRRAADFLDALTEAPQDGYFKDIALFAGLRLARAQLGVAREIAETDDAAATLWQVALAAEYGFSADAAQALKQAEADLAEALRRGAPQGDIDTLSKALAEATERYVGALALDAARKGRFANAADATNRPSLGAEDLERMQQQIRDRAKAGDAAGAQAMLQKYAQLLAGLQVQLTNGAPQEGHTGKSLAETQSDLAGESARQRALNDATRSGKAGQASDLASRQEGLASDLAQTRRDAEAGGAKDALDELDAAGAAMDRAQRKLAQGDLRGADADQQEALRRLHRGADRLAQPGQDQNAERGGGERDPLGRAMGAQSGEGNEVPTEIQRERARAILDEIRRREMDAQRPEAEKDYLRRLLERFGGS